MFFFAELPRFLVLQEAWGIAMTSLVKGAEKFISKDVVSLKDIMKKSLMKSVNFIIIYDYE